MRLASVAHVAVAALVGCGFTGPTISLGNADAPAVDAHPDAQPDAQADARVSSCNGKLWATSFDSDPTQLDDNGDVIKDWMLRDASPFPVAQLGGGMWHKPPNTNRPLDSQPKQPFTTRTIVDASMRAASVVTDASMHGAIFWINVGYAGDHSFAPLFVDATDDGTNQHLRIFIQNAQQQYVQPANAPVIQLGRGLMIEFRLDIDPANLVAVFTLEAPLAMGPVNIALVRQPPGSNPGDQWATLDTYAGAGDFDALSVEVCP